MDKFVQNSLFRRLQIERSQFLKYLFKEYDWISVGAVSSAVSQLVLSPTNLTSMVASGANSHKKNLAAERCHGSSLKGSILWVCIYSTSFKATLAQEAVSPVHVSNTNYGKYLTWWLLEVVKPLRFTRSWTKKNGNSGEYDVYGGFVKLWHVTENLEGHMHVQGCVFVTAGS